MPGRGVALNLTRTYSTVFAAVNGPFGYGWTDSYNMSLSVDSGTGDVTISQENGAQVSFTPSGGGYTAALDVAATLSTDTSTGDYLFKRDAQNLYTFNPGGQLIKETDLNGYVTTLAYNGSGQLATVTDPAGRHLTFTWTGINITSVTDPLGRTVTYTYDGSGNLASASDPAGKSHYLYVRLQPPSADHDRPAGWGGDQHLRRLWAGAHPDRSAEPEDVTTRTAGTTSPRPVARPRSPIPRAASPSRATRTGCASR